MAKMYDEQQAETKSGRKKVEQIVSVVWVKPGLGWQAFSHPFRVPKEKWLFVGLLFFFPVSPLSVFFCFLVPLFGVSTIKQSFFYPHKPYVCV